MMKTTSSSSASIFLSMICIIALCNTFVVHSFVVVRQSSTNNGRYNTILLKAGRDDNNEKNTGTGTGGFIQGWNNFWTELDNFMDDASARRLGNGAAFYGKRKSNFYGKNDKNKKENSQIADPTEDYQAPNVGGYFQWMPDEDGQLRPVTRLKKQNIERNPKFWDRFYDKQDEVEQESK